MEKLVKIALIVSAVIATVATTIAMRTAKNNAAIRDNLISLIIEANERNYDKEQIADAIVMTEFNAALSGAYVACDNNVHEEMMTAMNRLNEAMRLADEYVDNSVASV